MRFETPPVDLVRFEVEFTDESGATRIVWLFSTVLGYSRLIWARFIIRRDLQSVLRCHIAALEAIGGVPREILHEDRGNRGRPGWSCHLQPRPSRPRAALRLPAA